MTVPNMGSWGDAREQLDAGADHRLHQIAVQFVARRADGAADVLGRGGDVL
jgi:hypothetical protein